MAAGIIIIFIIIIALVSSCTKNRKYTLTELENKLITLSKNYYQKNESSLPSNGETKTLSTTYFISNGYFKELKLTSGETCTGEITVTNNNNYYLYSPKLNCGSKIKPLTIAEKLTDEENIVTVGEGLYNYNNSYIYRGENIKNYLEFNNKLWRIIKVNNDNTVRIIENTRSTSSTWDNRYNLERKSSTGINDFVANNINSRIKNKLEELYNTERIFKDEVKAYFATQDLCIGKRSENDEAVDGSIECSVKLENQALGLLQVNEYFAASLDPNCTGVASLSCTNYNYLARLDSSTWTLTADKDSTYKAYKLDYGIELSNTSNYTGISIVAHISSEALYKSGDGSLNDPYTLK